MLEIEPEGLLCASTETEDNVLRPAFVELTQQFGVVDGLAVDGREVEVILGDGDAVVLQPGKIALRGGRSGHDPEAGSRAAEFGLFEQCAEVLQSGEFGDAVSLDEVPEQHHEGAVCYGEVGTQQGLAVAGIVGQVFKRGGCGNHHQATLAELIDGLLGVGHDEAYPKNALETDRSVDGLFSFFKDFWGKRRRSGATLT